MNETNYHHGDLKKDMIKKGLQLLANEGYEALSLRKLAQMCNVSHAAPYKHFKNKDELISLIIFESTSNIEIKFQNALLKCQNDPRNKLSVIAHEYVNFMLENQDYFKYIFTINHGVQIIYKTNSFYGSQIPPFEIVKIAAKEYFYEIKGSQNWELDTIALWSFLHGLCLLIINKTLEMDSDINRFIEDTINKLLG
jgi:AcrR family transcriptional regulator